MFAASKQDKPPDVILRDRGSRGSAMSSPKAKRNNHGRVASLVSRPSVTLPALCQDQQRLPALAFKPLSGRTSILEHPPAPPKTASVSVLELPRLIAQVGPEKATGDTKWMQGPRLMASALSTDIPVRSVQGSETTTQSLTGRDESMILTIKKDKRKNECVKETMMLHKGTLSGTEVVEILATKRNPGEFDFYYLKEVDEDSFRPYDLRVVHPNEAAGAQHYVFSPSTVLHVTEKGYGGFVTLEEWYREAALWRALRELSFFRDYPLRKAFTRWHRNVCKIFFQRKCETLQNLLLMAVPQFRNGLFLLSRVIEEVKETPWMPQLDEAKTYTVMEFKNMLTIKNKQWMGIIERLLHYRTVVLNMVQEDSYSTCQELQFRVERSTTPRGHQRPLHLQLAHHREWKNQRPLHLQLAHRREWKKDLVQAEDVMQRLGNMATLVDQMIMQGVVAVTRRKILSFLDDVMKREKPLFRAQLMLSADGQLTVDPPVHLFDGVVREALLTVGGSAVQMLDAYGFFHETNDSEACSGFRSCAPELTPHGFNMDGCSAFTGVELETGMTGVGSVLYCDQSDQADRPTPPELSGLVVQGQRLRGCYHPLLKKQLEWQLRNEDLSEELEREQARIMQEIQSEIQQLCEEEYAWLADVRLFISHWSPAACLEALRDQPASLYEEHIEKVCSWTERTRTLPPTFTTSNKLFVVHCAHVQETLGVELKSIVGEVKAQLVEEMKRCSESLISDLKRSISELSTEPCDFYDLNKYASMVRQCERNTANMQLRLERVHSLQEAIRKTCRKMTSQEVTLEDQMLSLWRRYVPLLKQAKQTVCQRVPSVADTLDHTFSSLVNDLAAMASSDATSGPFLDPTRNADEMFSRLSDVCGQVHAVSAKLKELSAISENLRGHPLDLTVVTTALQTLEARKGLWELTTACTAQIREWKRLQLGEFVVSKALEQVDMWRQQAVSLSSIIPTNDAVLRETLHTVEHFNQQLSVMDKLCSPSGVTRGHWSKIFKGMGRMYTADTKLSVDDLMSSKQFAEHQESIGEICLAAKAEWDMKQALQKLQQGWEARLFGLAAAFTVVVWRHDDGPRDRTCKEFPADDTVSTSQQHPVQQSCDGGDTFIITDVEILLAETEDSVRTLSNMLESPHVADFRPEVEDFVHLLQELEELLDFFERYQQTWVFLAKMFSKTTICNQRVELLERFHPVDKTFRDILRSISSDPHVLSIAQSKKTNDPFHGSSLRQILINDLSTMEAISNQMLHVPRGEFPRLCFLSDREVIKLLSLHPTPSALLPAVRKCFRGVRWLEVDCEVTNDAIGTSDKLAQMKIRGVFGSFREHVGFQCPVEHSVNPLVCLSLVEKQLLQTMTQLVKACTVARTRLEPSDQDLKTDSGVGRIKLPKKQDLLPMLNLVSDYPLQCLLVAEEVVWCADVLRINLQASGPTKWNRVKTRKSSILKTLCHVIREGTTGAKEKSQVSNRTMLFLRALVQLTMNHAQQISKLMDVKCELASSFEWQSSLKYHITSHDQSETENALTDYATCYVDVLGTQLLYGYEYLGPEPCMVVNTPSTERAILGILLALTSYRCGFVTGPSMSGKKMTVVQLGRALGRQVIALQCFVSTSPSIVQQMLLGALQTGAWLVLDAVDSLKQGTLSLLGQHLEDIHQSFSDCKTILRQKVRRETRDRMTNMNQACQNRKEPEFPMSFAGEDIFAKLSYGCVVISSKGHTAEVAESLQAATRPIAFMQPDYRVITEVALASIGFSEAISLSQCLTSLFSMAKDSNCLPEFMNEDRIGLLVVLQKIVAASVIRLDGRSSTLMYNRQSAAIVQGLAEEKAVVKALFSTVVPYICELKKASRFRTLLEETFPMARYFPFVPQRIEEEEQNVLRDAVTEELQRAGFHPDAQTICNSLALYQAMKVSRAVVLIGPSGSGKSTCYHVLAGALRNLAARTAEQVVDDGDNPRTEPQIPLSNWHSVDTLVLFPNAMHRDEVFGCCREERGWWDGAFTKVLRDSERQDLSAAAINDGEISGRDQTQKVKWLVMDGEPLGQPGWLDCFTTLCDPDEPSLYLSSGERLVPSQSKLKLLAETTDLKDAAPSAVTRCSLVHFTGADLWKAVWKVEMNALRRERSLEEGTLKMWNRLAEDLFCRTLDALRREALASVLHGEGDGSVEFSNPPTYGLQEIMSFFRIVRALLDNFWRDSGSNESPSQTYKRDMPLLENVSDTDIYVISTQKELQARDIFLVAYIWGFGGHLHPRHWPQFDTLARQVLFDSRYRVEVPDEGTIFEHFFNQSEGTIADIINGINCPRVRDPCLASPVIPKYEKHVYLLKLMLEAEQPVMLVGEASSGKTMLCETLLNQDRPHVSLPASPLLSSRDVRNVLNNMSSKTAMRRQSGLLLFVDDLHEAPCDAFGKSSMALETLRQSVSKGHIQTYDDYHFKCVSCRGISYMATCCTPRSGHGSGTAISSRLSRLFSILVLPSLSAEVLFSLHSPRLKLWLKDLPCLQGSAELTRCIVGATQHLFRATCEQFPPTAQSPHYMFSHHDLQKVFQGMCLWQPCSNTNQEDTSLVVDVTKSSQTGLATSTTGYAASVRNIVHLWMHECLRTFSDRLSSVDEGKAMVSLIARVSAIYYGSELVDKSSSTSPEDKSTAMILTTSAAITDNLKSSSLDTPNESEGDRDASSSQLAPEALLNLTTLREEVESRQSGRPSSIESTSSDSSSIRSHGTKEDISFSKEENTRNTVQYKKDELILRDASLCEVLIPSPPKGPKPAAQSERGHRFSEHSEVQNEGLYSGEPSSAPCLLPSQLLQDMEQAMTRIVFGPEITDPANPTARQYDLKRDASYQERDFDLLVQRLSASVKRREERGEKSRDSRVTTSGYALHRQRTHQLLHILRALLMPGGHGVLFGAARGTGRKSNVRLAAHLTGYRLMEVHPGNEERLREILKEAIFQTEVNGANVVILAHEETSQAVREELLMVMASGTCPGLHSEEELANLVPRENGVKDSHRCHVDSHALERHLRQFQRNMHVFLLLPLATSEGREWPHYNTQAWKAHITKAMSLSSCVEVYQPWSRQSFVEAATHCLKDNLRIPELHGQHAAQSHCLEASMPLAMARIHQAACRYASVLLNTQPFSPQTYMEFICHFFYLSSHLYKQGLCQANRVTTVLARLEAMTDTAVQYKHNVITLQECVAQAQQWEKELMRAMDAQRMVCDRARQSVVFAQMKLFQLEEQIHQTKHKESPLFQLSLKIFKCLSSSDLEEVRRYTNPPEGVVKIMDALCLLFNRPCNWESAKQLLVQSDFFQELEFFDRHRLAKSQLRALGRIVHSPHFQPESVREVSHACESLCNWVRAVYEYSCMERRMAGHGGGGVSKQRLGKLAEEARGRLVLAELREEEAFGNLADMERRLQAVQKELAELLEKLSRAEGLDRHAAAVVGQMRSHVADWNTAAREADVNNQTLPGDALVLAAAISYLGPFEADTRTELLHKWRELCLTGTMNINPEDPRTSLLTKTDCSSRSEPSPGTAIPVAEELQWALARALGMEKCRFQGLPARLVAKLLLWGYRSPWVQHWPLLADTQHHKELITDFEKEPEYGLVLCADDPELLDKLKQAAENGVRVLVSHVERAVPDPQFLAMLVRPAACRLHLSAGLRRPFQPTHPQFCLFLSTHLPVRLLSSEIHPSILAEVQVVDLALSSAETQELLLSRLLLQSERVDALTRKTRVSRDKRTLQDKLMKEEVSLMDYVLQSSVPLLQDPEFLPRVLACRDASLELRTEVKQMSVELELCETRLSAPRDAARLAAALYRDLQDVARVSPVYLFPLCGFITAIGEEALVPKGDAVSGGQVTEGMISEITHRMVSRLLAQYRPRLFRSHAALLKLLTSVTLLQHQKMCSRAERAAFLRGLGGDLDVQEEPETEVDSPLCAGSTPALPGWIPPRILPELLRLERIPSFGGLLSSLAASPGQWREYLRLPSSTVAGAVPCSSHSRLSLMQRALLWRTLLPHSLVAVAEGLAACCNLGLSSEAPHCGNPEGLSRLLVTHDGPVVLTSPGPGRENWASIRPLRLLKQLATCRGDAANRVQLKVISCGSECETEVMLSVLDRAVTDGHWLVFNDCHRLERWDDKVMLRLNRLASSSRAAVRARALHLVCDCPGDVKEELGSSLCQAALSADVRSDDEGTSSPRDATEPSLLRCAIVHSVLLQRQTCRTVQGQRNIYYHWTQEDLQALVEAHIHIASRCDNKMEALEYIAVNLVHGGHVSDPADLEAVASVVKACLNTASPLCGSGPHVLAGNIINIPAAGHFASGCFDVSGLLRGLERYYTQDSAHVSDPLMLGFGADVAAEMLKANGRALNDLLRDSQVPRRGEAGGRGDERNNRGATLLDYGRSRERLQALKSTLATKDTRTVTTSDGTAPRRGPVRDFLLAEWDGLSDLVSSLISRLEQPMMSQHGKPSTSSSLLAFADLLRLERRAELLRAYLWDEACEGTPPTAYRLSAFSNARGFLVAVRREAAQAQRKDVSNVGLHFQVLSVFSPPAASPPLTQDGVYLCGLELRGGALWDTGLGALQDTLPPSSQPSCAQLPLLWVRPSSRAAGSDTHTTTALYGHHQREASHHVPKTDACTRVLLDAPRLPVYHCPLYLGEERGRGDAGVVAWVPLAAELHPVLCGLRGVRLVSTL